VKDSPGYSDKKFRDSFENGAPTYKLAGDSKKNNEKFRSSATLAKIEAESGISP